MSADGTTLVLRWKAQAPDDVTKDLTQRGQFNSERVVLVEALVREAFQNVLDASDPASAGPIRVRVAMKPSDPSGPAFQGGLLLALKDHLTACGMKVADVQLTHPGFLVIEDFQTTGLLGPWDNTGASGWNDFFRSFGASHKGGRTGGRWGLGKLVFTSASAIRTFFALTVHAGDSPPAPLLMGQTVAKTHEVAGTTFGSHGFLCMPGRDGEIQLPVTDPGVIATFAAEAGAVRTLQPGLSIAVAAPIADVDASQIVTFLLENYFFPIIEGRLVVDVAGTEVSAATFDALVQSHGSLSMRGGRLAAFIREIGVRRTSSPDAQVPAGWPSAPDMGLAADALDALRKSFADGELVHVRFPLRLKTKEGADRPTHVDVMLRQARPDENAASVVVRGLLTLPVEADRLKADGCFAALLAEDDAIVSFLGDAEGPAHTEWNPRAERVEERWRNPTARLSEVRKAPRVLLAALAPALNREEVAALRDEFSVARPEGAPDTKPRAPKDTSRSPFDKDIQAPKRKFRVTKRLGGFAVAAGQGLEAADLPMRIRVRMAFDVPRGNPFKQHHRFDFDLTGNDIVVRETNARVDAVNAHTVLITAHGADFRVIFDGFDPNRDLVVDPRRSIEP